MTEERYHAEYGSWGDDWQGGLRQGRLVQILGRGEGTLALFKGGRNHKAVRPEGWETSSAWRRRETKDLTRS